jgi:hypothetical protein
MPSPYSATGSAWWATISGPGHIWHGKTHQPIRDRELRGRMHAQVVFAVLCGLRCCDLAHTDPNRDHMADYIGARPAERGNIHPHTSDSY